MNAKRKTGKLRLVHAVDNETDNKNYIAPSDLHEYLQPTNIKEITFRSEKKMAQYRNMLYSINKQGQLRYRTMRSDASHWAIAVWRMK